MREAEGLALELLAEPGGGLSKRGAITQHPVTDPGELVGQGAGGLVVGTCLQLQGPVANPAGAAAFGRCDPGGLEHGARAMSEQHAQVFVAAFADSTDPSGGA